MLQKGTRRLVFYVLVIVFVLLAPIILGYSFGYNFDFSQNTLQKTGGIFLKSKNQRIAIFLNGVFIKETSFFSNGALFTNLLPSTYLLRVEKEGYTPWSKTIRVDSSFVTEIRNILLISKTIQSATTTPQNNLLIADFKQKQQTAPLDLRLNKNSDLVELTGTTTRVVMSRVLAFHVDDNTVYVVTTSGFLAKLNRISKEVVTIGRPGFFLRQGTVTFSQSPHGELVILDGIGGTFVLEKDGTIQSFLGGVSQVRFDESGEKALLIKEKEIDLLWLQDSRYQPFEKKYDIETVFESKDPILDAEWYFADNAHFAVMTRQGIYFSEIDSRGGKNTVELFSTKVDDLITIPDTPKVMYFQKGKTFFKIPIEL